MSVSKSRGTGARPGAAPTGMVLPAWPGDAAGSRSGGGLVSEGRGSGQPVRHQQSGLDVSDGIRRKAGLHGSAPPVPVGG